MQIIPAPINMIKPFVKIITSDGLQMDEDNGYYYWLRVIFLINQAPNNQSSQNSNTMIDGKSYLFESVSNLTFKHRNMKIDSRMSYIRYEYDSLISVSICIAKCKNTS